VLFAIAKVGKLIDAVNDIHASLGLTQESLDADLQRFQGIAKMLGQGSLPHSRSIPDGRELPYSWNRLLFSVLLDIDAAIIQPEFK